MIQFKKILQILTEEKVNFVVIGGLAAVAQGSARLTADIDICYERSDENIKKIVGAFKDRQITLRGAPKDLPFIFDEKTLKGGMNFTFSSDLGDIDFLGEISGLGSFHDVIKVSEIMELYGLRCRVLTIEGLLKTKKAANRPKDQEHIAELTELLKLKSVKTDT